MAPFPSLTRAFARGAWARRSGWSAEPTLPPLSAEYPGVRPDPAWLDAYRGVCGADVLPLCWPQTWATRGHVALLVDPAFPVRPDGLVHPRVAIAQHRPVDPGRPFDLALGVEAPRRVDHGVEFDLVTRVLQDGALAWESRAATFSRTSHERRTEARHDPPLPTGRTVEMPLPRDAGRRYAAVSGDWNPVHLHALLARLSGYAAPIGHGQWLVARALVLLGAAAAEGARSVEARFLRPVFLGSALQLVANDAGEFAVAGDDGKPRIVGRLG